MRVGDYSSPSRRGSPGTACESAHHQSLDALYAAGRGGAGLHRQVATQELHPGLAALLDYAREGTVVDYRSA